MCVYVFEWIIAIVFVYTCVVTICRRRYGHVSTAFRIPWIVYSTFLGRTITRSTAFTATPLLPLVFSLLKYLFFYILDPLGTFLETLEKLYLDPYPFIPFFHPFLYFSIFSPYDCKISFCISCCVDLLLWYIPWNIGRIIPRSTSTPSSSFFSPFPLLLKYTPLSYNVACLWIQFYFEFKSNSNPHAPISSSLLLKLERRGCLRTPQQFLLATWWK